MCELTLLAPSIKLPRLPCEIVKRSNSSEAALTTDDLSTFFLFNFDLRLLFSPLVGNGGEDFISRVKWRRGEDMQGASSTLMMEELGFEKLQIDEVRLVNFDVSPVDGSLT